MHNIFAFSPLLSQYFRQQQERQTVFLHLKVETRLDTQIVSDGQHCRDRWGWVNIDFI